MPVQMKEIIAEAFLALAEKKSFDKITVKDVVEACGGDAFLLRQRSKPNIFLHKDAKICIFMEKMVESSPSA